MFKIGEDWQWLHREECFPLLTETGGDTTCSFMVQNALRGTSCLKIHAPLGWMKEQSAGGPPDRPRDSGRCLVAHITGTAACGFPLLSCSQMRALLYFEVNEAGVFLFFK